MCKRWQLLLGLAAAVPAQAGPLAYVPDLRSGVLAVIDTQRAAVVGHQPYAAVYAASVQGLMYDSGGRAIYLADAIGGIRGRVLMMPARGTRPDREQPTNISLAPDARHLAMCDHVGGEVVMVDTAQLAEAWRVRVQAAAPGQCGFSPDGRWLLVQDGARGTIELLDVAGRKSAGLLQAASGARGFGFAPDGRTLYVATGLGDAYAVVDTASWQPRRILVAHPYRRPPAALRVSRRE